jgi:hypothetical protein
MKKLSLIVLFVLVIIPLVFAPVAYARNEKIEGIRFDGDCAGITFNRGGKDVRIRLLRYTKCSGNQWKYLGDEFYSTGSGNFAQFCGLSLHRCRVKLTAQIIVNGKIKHSMTKVFRM